MSREQERPFDEFENDDHADDSRNDDNREEISVTAPVEDNYEAEEDDPRFPTGPWIGFFLQPQTRRHEMELDLRFSHGSIRGDGYDLVGEFIVRGRYDTADGKCHFHKRYIGQHDVYYEGFNEGKGIYGKWEINGSFSDHGGFCIWPKGMADPTKRRVSNAIDLPAVTFDNLDGELIHVGAGDEDTEQTFDTEPFDGR